MILGKAATHEFALGVTTPQSRNPHDPTRIPGGSSGGSAVAVATGMGLASLGTDTRASIRVPAALSGSSGFKPTYGRVPTDGVVSLSWTMDHVAPMAATVADAALVLEALPGGAGAARGRRAASPGCASACPRRPSRTPTPRSPPPCDAAIEALADGGRATSSRRRARRADLDAGQRRRAW